MYGTNLHGSATFRFFLRHVHDAHGNREFMHLHLTLSQNP
jgi:hypothetical protein